MAEFKYTDEEIDKLIEWFEGRELPQSIRLNKASFIPDTKKTVNSLLIIARQKRIPTFQPLIDKLFQIKDIIENPDKEEAASNQANQ